jgi:hypothetical protein
VHRILLIGMKAFYQIKSFQVKKVYSDDVINYFKEFEMKRFIFVAISCIVALAFTGRHSFAQTDSGMKGDQKGEMKQQGMKMDEEMMKQMMEKCQPMMKKMTSDDMMKMEMMQMMMGMMNMQEKMMKGPKPAEKKKMMKDMAQMKEKMQKMMSMHMDMTDPDTSGAQPKEVEVKEPPKEESPKADPHKHY